MTERAASKTQVPKAALLCILDGFGLGDKNYEYNAVAKAKMPNLRRILSSYPHSQIQTSGASVGLPEGQMGNSEVGHTCIGAGRVVYQDLPKINLSIQSGEIYKKIALEPKIKRVHVIGMVSSGGVHSHINHILSVVNFYAQNGTQVFVHAISDGRDVSTDSFISDLQFLQNSLHKNAKVVTICGRYYAMDRDNRWNRTELAFNCYVYGSAAHLSDNLIKSTNEFYESGTTDEFIKPTAINGYAGIEPGDAVFFANFRADRMRQIVESFVIEDFAKFDRQGYTSIKECITIASYSSQISKLVKVVFENEEISNTLPEIISSKGLKQLRVAETEKYAHVTFFFNGGKEAALQGEDRILVPSPNVSTYDIKPEMSAFEVIAEVERAAKKNEYSLIITNIANGDMVGHTGNFSASVRAAEVIDNILGTLETIALNENYIVLVTADHGNLEEMVDRETGKVHTQHTTLDVPLIVMCQNKNFSLKNGSLQDIAPTLLDFMGIEKPLEMTGQSLTVRK